MPDPGCWVERRSAVMAHVEADRRWDRGDGLGNRRSKGSSAGVADQVARVRKRFVAVERFEAVVEPRFGLRQIPSADPYCRQGPSQIVRDRSRYVRYRNPEGQF